VDVIAAEEAQEDAEEVVPAEPVAQPAEVFKNCQLQRLLYQQVQPLHVHHPHHLHPLLHLLHHHHLHQSQDPQDPQE